MKCKRNKNKSNSKIKNQKFISQTEKEKLLPKTNQMEKENERLGN
jgi:hypothetical protein